MGKKELKKLKRELDELFGEKEAGLLNEIIDLLETQDKRFVVLGKLVKAIAQLKEAQPPAKAFEDLLEAVKELDLTLPEIFKVEVENQKEFPKRIEVKDLQKILTEAVKKIVIPTKIKVSNLKEIPKPQVNIPDKFKIQNFDELVKLLTSNIPDKIDLKKPDWYEALTKEQLAGFVIKGLQIINRGDGLRVDLDKYRNAKRALAVRLSTGKGFYNAMVQALAAGVAFPFKTLAGKALEALVDDDGHVQVDVLSDPGTAASTTPNEFNVTMAGVNTEYSQALPTGTDRFTIQNRANNNMRISFTTGKVATPTAPYITVKAGMWYYAEGLKLTSVTIYFATVNAGDVAEIIAWS